MIKATMSMSLYAALFNTTILGTVVAHADDTTVGLAVAQSGSFAAYDGDATNTVLLWIDDQNAKGGLLGGQIKSVISDTESDRAQGARAGQDVVDQGAQLVVVSCDYDYGAPAAGAAQRANIASVFLCAEDPKAGVQGAGPFAFTSSVAAQVQGAAMAGWSHKALGTKTYYTLLDTSIEYDKSVCAGAEWAAEKLGMTSLGADTFKNDDPSIQAQITRIGSLATKPDAVFLCTFTPGGVSALRQIRASGLDMPIFSGSAMDGTYWTDAVPDLNDFYLPVQASVHGDDPRAEVNDFIKRFTVKYGHAPASTYGVPIYAFLDLWAKAVESAGTTDASVVVPLMEQYKDAETMIGPKTFTSENHIQLDALMQILKYENGKPKVVDSFQLGEPIPTSVLFRTK